MTWPLAPLLALLLCVVSCAGDNEAIQRCEDVCSCSEPPANADRSHGGFGGTGGDGGAGGSGGTGGQDPECRVNADCPPGGSPEECIEGRCFPCEHIDVMPFFVDTPTFWNPEALVSGTQVGLDEEFAYWLIGPDDELFSEAVRFHDNLFVCSPLQVEGGQPLDTGDECQQVELLPARYGDDDELHAPFPVAPASWLDTGPTDGVYYTQILFNAQNPIYLCEPSSTNQF